MKIHVRRLCSDGQIETMDIGMTWHLERLITRAVQRRYLLAIRRDWIEDPLYPAVLSRRPCNKFSKTSE